jgi:hypothetical protein
MAALDHALLSRLLDKTLYVTDPDAVMNRVLPYD